MISQCILQIGDIKINQVHECKYKGNVVTEYGKCDIDTRKRIGMAKDAF